MKNTFGIPENNFFFFFLLYTLFDDPLIYLPQVSGHTGTVATSLMLLFASA